MSQLKLILFGPPRFECQGKEVELSLRKALALLIYLAVTKGEFSRDELATLFWPESDWSSARANLRRTLYLINKKCDLEVLSAGKEIVRLNPHIDLWTDVEAFSQFINNCDLIESTLEDLDVEQIKMLEKAATLYTSDFLTGFSLPDSPEFDEWQFFETESLRRMLVTALKQLVSAYQSQGDFTKAIFFARRWLVLDSMHEPTHRLLMELYAKSGQQAAALRQYSECERILDQELGLSPQPETTKLYQNIRQYKSTSGPPLKLIQPGVHYIESGDVHIAYVEVGEGPVDILMVLGYITHMEQVWELPEVRSFFDQLASFSRVILFDRRGVGLSERVGYAPTIEDTLDDIRAVMDATGAKHPVFFGYLEGGPSCMLFAATYPEKVSGLILYGTRAKWTRSEDYPWTLTREQYDHWLEYICSHWGKPTNLDAYAPSRSEETHLQEWWAKLMRLSSSPRGIKAVLEVMRDIDVRDVLPAIRCPTLILQRKGDRAIRVGAARHLAGQIPGAKYVEFEGQDHWFFMGDCQPILIEMQNFVQNLGSPAIPDYMLATIMLVEIMDDVQFDPKQLDSISALLRQEIARYRGSEVSWKGSCCTAIFDGPTRAIHCTKNIIQRTSQQEITTRASLHTGECEFVAGKLIGIAVEIVGEILKFAAPNEILVSSTVKDLVVGSGFQFNERDRLFFDDISGSWGIYSLS